jgi:hypothetical protein
MRWRALSYQEKPSLLAAALAYRPQPWAWPRPRPPYLPHARRRLTRLRGVVRSGARSPVTLAAYLYLPHDWLGLELPPTRSHLSADCGSSVR